MFSNIKLWPNDKVKCSEIVNIRKQSFYIISVVCVCVTPIGAVPAGCSESTLVSSESVRSGGVVGYVSSRLILW